MSNSSFETSRKNAKTTGRTRWALLALVASLLLCGTAARATQNVMLGWNRVVDPTVMGYVIYYGTATGNYSHRLVVGTNTTTTITGLKEGQTNYFAVTAYNSSQIESALSAEIPYVVPGVLRLSHGPKANSPNTISFPMAPGHWYEVQGSVDLKVWTTLNQTALATSNVWGTFTDNQSTNMSKRFYRLILH